MDKLKEDAPKNFCFVTFDKEEPAKQLVMKGFTSIKGHQVIVSRVSFERIRPFYKIILHLIQLPAFLQIEQPFLTRSKFIRLFLSAFFSTE